LKSKEPRIDNEIIWDIMRNEIAPLSEALAKLEAGPTDRDPFPLWALKAKVGKHCELDYITF
jgi:hypothetical protein